MNFIPDLGLVIGTNTARRRAESGLSQSDLLEKLNAAGGRWSAAAISLLENRGARGERLSDVAELCQALEVSLWDLLGDARTSVETQSGAIRDLDWIVSALAGPGPQRRRPRRGGTLGND